MPALQVRDMPPDLYDRLCEEAKNQHRSIAQQTVYQLEQSFRVIHSVPDAMLEDDEEARAKRIEKRKKLFAEIEARPYDPFAEGAPDAVDVIREMREERTNQIMEACGFHE